MFPHEIKLREHAKDLHPSLLDANSAGRDREWRTYIQDAAAKAYVSLGVPSKLITSQDQVLPEVPKDLEVALICMFVANILQKQTEKRSQGPSKPDTAIIKAIL